MAGRRRLQGANYPIRTSTRNRVAKQFPDYTDCSFRGRGIATKRKANGLPVNSDRSSTRGGRRNGILEIYVLFYAFN